MRAVWLAIFVCAAGGGTARAEPPAEDRALAKRHYGRAVDLVQAGKHREAIAAFEEAYRAAARPNILFNIAQEYRTLQDRKSVV